MAAVRTDRRADPAMPKRTFPWVEPVYLNFTSPDLMNTSIVSASAPSMSISFQSSPTPSRETSAEIQPPSAAPSPSRGRSAESYQPPQSLIEPAGETSVEHFRPLPTPSVVQTRQQPPASPPETLYRISTEVERSRLRPKRFRTTIHRGESERVASITWSRFRGYRVSIGQYHDKWVGVLVERENGWVDRSWLNRALQIRQTVTIADSEGRRYAWNRKKDAQSDMWWYYLSYSDHTRDEKIATIAFEAEDNIYTMSSTKARHRLDRSIVELRLRVESHARLQEMQDLCVVSGILILLRDRHELFKK